jgi:ribosomal-protein-alanine acetyltransferase
MRRAHPSEGWTANYSVRGGAPSDLDAIDRIEGRSFGADRFARRNLRRLLKSPASAFLVAEAAGRPAGYAMLLFRRDAGVARLYSIAVDPDHRGRGLAERLIAEASQKARDRGASRLRLELRPSNAVALRLYERAGFKAIEGKSGYYVDGEDAIRMDLALLPVNSGDRSAQS